MSIATSVRNFVREATHTRVAESGVASLSDVELVALVVPARKGRCNHNDASHLLAQFGGLRPLLTADRATLNAAGLPNESINILLASMELTRRHYHALMLTGSPLGNPRATREYLRMRCRDLPHEVFGVVYLDNRNRVIACEELFRGTIDGASVHPREVVKAALAKNAAAVILFHNHPSGVAEPSQADELITRRLKDALAMVEIRTLDHLIIGDGVCESFAERGLL